MTGDERAFVPCDEAETGLEARSSSGDRYIETSQII